MAASDPISDGPGATHVQGHMEPLSVEQEVSNDPSKSDSPLGEPPKGFIGRTLFTIYDNFLFAGEVLVDFLNLDKPRYHEQIEHFKKLRRKEAKDRARREAAAIAKMEDPDAVGPKAEPEQLGSALY